MHLHPPTFFHLVRILAASREDTLFLRSFYASRPRRDSVRALFSARLIGAFFPLPLLISLRFTLSISYCASCIQPVSLRGIRSRRPPRPRLCLASARIFSSLSTDSLNRCVHFHELLLSRFNHRRFFVPASTNPFTIVLLPPASSVSILAIVSLQRCSSRRVFSVQPLRSPSSTVTLL